METTLYGAVVRLRPATAADIPALVRIRATPEVYQRWRGDEDLAADVAEDLDDPQLHLLTIEYEGRVVGGIQWSEETDPDYRHASIDIFLDPAVHGRGLGTDAVRTLARHLIEDHGHHRLQIDPAADNAAAIRCYHKVGFRPVGILRRYERGPGGTWHDGLLMDLLADEFGEVSPGQRRCGAADEGALEGEVEQHDRADDDEAGRGQQRDIRGVLADEEAEAP